MVSQSGCLADENSIGSFDSDSALDFHSICELDRDDYQNDGTKQSIVEL